MKKRSCMGALVLMTMASLAITGCPGSTEPGQSGEKKILSFAVAVAGEFKEGIIDEANHTVSLTLPAGTSVQALAPVIAVSAKATVSPASGTVRDFTAPVTYTVTAEDGSVQAYTVTVSSGSTAADKTALSNAITAATAAKTGIVADTDAANVSVGTQWVAQGALDTFNAAIAAANTVAQNTAATQAEVDAAETTLNAAITAFNSAKQAGTKPGPAADKTALSAAIATATAAKTGIAVNTAAANVPVGTQWVAQGVMDTFNTAISTAETVVQNATAAQAEVDAAVTALNGAVAAFNDAKQAGTKPGPAEDRTALDTAIATATAAKTGIVVNTAAANVLEGTQWVTQGAMDTFDGVIAAAETVSQNTAATQAQVDAATAALNSAVAAFNAAKQAGTKPGPAEDKTALNARITAANAAKAGIAVDTNGANVPMGTQWVTETVMATFDAAIAVAEAVAQDADANQAQVDAAADTLNTAITAFNAAKQDGTKPETAADKTALNAAIATATAAKIGIVVDTDAGNVFVGIQWVIQDVMDTFNAAIATAETVSQNIYANQAQVDAAVTALNGAVDTFNTAKQAGTNASGSLQAVVTIVVPPFTDGGAGIAEEQRTITLYRNGNPKQATVGLSGTTGAAIEWRTGGAVKGTGTSLTIHAGDYNAGIYYFTVEVVRDNVPWSTEFTLIVIDNQSAD